MIQALYNSMLGWNPVMKDSTVEQKSFGEAQDGLKSEDDKIEVLEGDSGDRGLVGLRQRARDSPSNTGRCDRDSSGIEVM